MNAGRPKYPLARLISRALLLSSTAYHRAAAQPIPFSQLSARANDDDDSKTSASKSNDNDSDDQSWTSKYSQYKIAGFPLYIWIFILVALLICGGIGFFFMKKKKRESLEAQQMAAEAREWRQAELEAQKRGIPPDPEAELEEADRIGESWKTPKAEKIKQEAEAEDEEEEYGEEEAEEEYEEEDVTDQQRRQWERSQHQQMYQPHAYAYEEQAEPRGHRQYR